MSRTRGSEGVDAWANISRLPVSFAQTSGSTGVPKRIAYTKTRVRETVGQFVASFAHAYWSTRPSRKSFYVLSSLQQDASLTSLMLEESKGFPPYLSGLQAPYRVQAHPDLRMLAEEYGANAMRVWVLALSNPGVLYCTNPSTLSTFLSALEEEWDKCRSLVVAWHRGELSWKSSHAVGREKTDVSRAGNALHASLNSPNSLSS